MSDQVMILTIALTLAFAFGMASGISLERQRRRRKAAQREIDWLRGAGHYPHLEQFVRENADEIAERRRAR